MAIQFKRGTTESIIRSSDTLKAGQPLLNTSTGCLYLNGKDTTISSIITGSTSVAAPPTAVPGSDFSYPALNQSSKIEVLAKAVNGSLSSIGMGDNSSGWIAPVTFPTKWDSDASKYYVGRSGDFIWIPYDFDTADLKSTTSLYLYQAYNSSSDTYYTVLTINPTGNAPFSYLPSGRCWFKVQLNADLVWNQSSTTTSSATGSVVQYYQPQATLYNGENLVLSSNYTTAYVDSTNYLCLTTE